MFNIRKIAFLVTLFFASVYIMTAQTGTSRAITDQRNYRFSLTPLAGILIGQSEEILYKYKNSDQYASQLLWDLKPLYYAGLALDFGPKDPFHKNGFTSAASLKFGFPLKTGIMEDRDWMDSYEEYLTHYSRHEAFSQNAILADISAGYTWHIKDFLAVSVFGEFSYMYFSWMAENGYYQYATRLSGPLEPLHFEKWNSSIEKKSIYGAGMRYTQNWLIFAPGISFKGRLSSFSLEANIKYSPLIYCADRDDHLLTYNDNGQLFHGTFSIGHYIDGGASFTYTPNNRIDLLLGLSYRYITGLRDNTYHASTGTEVSGISSLNFEGGVGYSAFDIKLAARIKIY